MHIVDCTTDWSVIGEPRARREWELAGGGEREGKGKGGVTLDTKRLKVVYICDGNTEKSVIY